MTDAAPNWNRFAQWPRLPARLLLGVLAVLLVMAMFAPIQAGEDVHPAASSQASAPASDARTRDEDLQLYDVVIARLQRGENYYDVAAAEHRVRHYPLRPGLAVRLPTLAVIEANAGLPVQMAASVLLLLAVLATWWRRFSEEAGAAPVRTLAFAALFYGASIGATRYFFVLHELWAGALLALSFGLHRPDIHRPDKGRWLGAWLAAAAALAIREHALPFVLLMAAFALWHRRWREGAAWIALTGLFAAGLALHLHTVAAQVLPGDPLGPAWITMRGLGGWLSMIVLASNLRFLPHILAGPIVLLMVLGWAGWRSERGAFGTLLFLGYGLGFMIAGRPDNWYWGMVVAPTMFVGLAFVPMALTSLWRAAFAQAGVASGAKLGQG